MRLTLAGLPDREAALRRRQDDLELLAGFRLVVVVHAHHHVLDVLTRLEHNLLHTAKHSQKVSQAGSGVLHPNNTPYVKQYALHLVIT